jgi:hypothetical protein
VINCINPSTIGHELAEAATDPELNAWQDADRNENADKCSWNFLNVVKQVAIP